MKEKIKNNKNKILIILAFILSLSGVVVFAEVTSNDESNAAKGYEARMLEASLLSSKDNKDSDTKIVTDDLTSLDSQDIDDESYNIEEETEEELNIEEETEVSDTEVLASEEALLYEKQSEIEEAYQEELASVDTKVVPIEYSNINFGKIGSLSAKDVHIGISTASSFVNIRESASEEGKILGKLYADEAAAILSVDNGWALIESGSVKGYVTTAYLNMNLTKDQVIESNGKLRATILVDGLNVRKEANEDAEVLTVVYENEKYKVLEVTDKWVKISIPKEDIVGYVSIELVKVSVSFEQAISIEEEQEIIRQQKEEERKKAEEAAKKKAEEEAKKKAAAKKKAQKQASKKAKSSSSKAATSSKAPAANHSDAEKAAKEEIARRESGGNYNARNGKYIGRYQLNKNYLGGDYSPENQERVADRYVAKRYGSWQKALKFWNANGWY